MQCNRFETDFVRASLWIVYGEVERGGGIARWYVVFCGFETLEW